MTTDYSYRHRIQYYETDKQGITHHSNYIRIMEETRVDWMETHGFGYEKMEAAGVFSPVMSVSCDYKKTTTFPDEVEVAIYVMELGTFKVRFGYRMTVRDVLVCQASSLHCFLGSNGRPVKLEEKFPALHEALKGMMVE